MIAAFPNFSRLNIDLYEEFCSYTQAMPCYSDCNFVSLFSWNTKGSTSISKLGKNIVIKQLDYSSLEPVISLIGTDNIVHYLETLKDYFGRSSQTVKLQLVPETTVNKLGSTGSHHITPDRDNFDYILDVEEHFSMKGKKFANKRNHIRKFETLYKEKYTVKLLNLSSMAVQNDILRLSAAWEKNSQQDAKDVANEKAALKRLLTNSDTFNLYSLGIYIDGTLKSFVINEAIDAEYEMGHFMKGDTRIKRIFTVMIHACMQYAKSMNRKYINIEQDLGIKPLRTAKLEQRPTSFLKKYTISLSPNPT